MYRKHPTKGKEWWQIIYYPIPRAKGGKSATVSFKGTEAEVQELEYQLRAEAKGEVRASSFPQFAELVPQYMVEYKTSHLKLGTERQGRCFKILSKFFGSHQVAGISAQLIEAYKANRLEQVSPSTIQKELCALSGFLKWCAKRNYRQPIVVEKFPTKMVKAPLPTIPTKIDLLTLINGTRWPKCGLLACLYLAGLRSAEGRNMQAKHIYFDKKLMLAIGKGNKERLVPIRKELFPILERRIKEVPSGLLWPGVGGKKRPDIRLNTECKGLGLPKITPHHLRHAFGSEATKKGVGLRALQTVMGHSVSTTTEIYAHVNADHLKSELDKM